MNLFNKEKLPWDDQTEKISGDDRKFVNIRFKKIHVYGFLFILVALVIIVTIFYLLVLNKGGWNIKNISNTISKGKIESLAISELDKYGIKTTGEASISKQIVPSIDHLNRAYSYWSYAHKACLKAGYDLSPYTGKEIDRTIVPINQYYMTDNTEPLEAMVISYGGEVLCACKSGQEGYLDEQFFAIDDMSIATSF